MRRTARRLARPGEGDDVLQNALIAAWRHRKKFDESRGSPRTWLTVITVNEARKSRRSWRRTEQLDDSAGSDELVPDVDLERAIGRLPRRQALAVQLHYFAGLSVRDTAAAMRCAEGTVKSTLAAARTALRALLGEDHHDD